MLARDSVRQVGWGRVDDQSLVLGDGSHIRPRRAATRPQWAEADHLTARPCCRWAVRLGQTGVTPRRRHAPPAPAKPASAHSRRRKSPQCLGRMVLRLRNASLWLSRQSPPAARAGPGCGIKSRPAARSRAAIEDECRLTSSLSPNQTEHVARPMPHGHWRIMELFGFKTAVSGCSIGLPDVTKEWGVGTRSAILQRSMLGFLGV